MRYETEYVIVAGVAWIRRSRVETRDGRVDESVWLVLFEGGTSVHKAPAGDSTPRAGEVDGIAWELDWTDVQPAFETPHALLRPLAPSHLVTTPSILVDGHIGDRVLEAAPGHTARLWGKKHAQTWGWSHATLEDGRWVHLLTATAPPLPRVSQFASDGRPPGLPFARGRVVPPLVEVGPYRVDAPVESFVGLRYLDTDGSDLWCYHSEQGHVRGEDLDVRGAALEIATREPIAGWSIGG